jgi:hypothetical protein
MCGFMVFCAAGILLCWIRDWLKANVRLVFTVLPVAAGVGAGFCHRPAAAAIDSEAILWAIRQVETGGNPAAVGKRGERSAYHFIPTTWSMPTSAPFLFATLDPVLANRVALDHLALILRCLKARGLAPTAAHIAAAWRYWTTFPLSAASSDYALRIEALYQDRTRTGRGSK